jgi:hypothetical protein
MPMQKRIETAWSTEEIALLKTLYADKPTKDLARWLERTPQSVSHKAAALGLKKSASHRSAQARAVALFVGLTADDMAALGSIGGQAGGPARTRVLTAKRRKEIAKKAVAARWAGR